jgi:hypothetical protein
MTELHTLLDRSVDHPTDLDTAADVRRGRAALTRRRRGTVLLGALAAVLAVCGTVTLHDRSPGAATTVQPAEPGPVRAGSFQIPAPPAGWSVQAADESLVVIAPAGLPKVDLHDPDLQLLLAGKLLVHLQRSGLPIQESTAIQHGGRTFYDYEGGGTGTQVGVAEPSGGWLILQEAPSLHWTTGQMVDYLAGVVVLGDAVPDSD